jgi:hypothetical protein
MRRDRLVGEFLHEHRLPVVLEPTGDQCVEGGVQRGIGHQLKVFHGWFGHVPETVQDLRSLLWVTGPAGHDRQEHRLAPPDREVLETPPSWVPVPSCGP